jgi:hypothetical protein
LTQQRIEQRPEVRRAGGVLGEQHDLHGSVLLVYRSRNMSARAVHGLVLLALASCSGEPPPADAGVASCDVLFGNPNDKTGLGADRCRPLCACEAAIFQPPTYDDAFVQSLLDDWRLATPFAPLASDPYAAPPPASDDPPGTVCAVQPQSADAGGPRPYTLVTYASEAAARAAGGHPTHFGRCGVCSPLYDLAVFMRHDDLTAPVRACAFAAGNPDGGDPDLACLLALGFDLPCAQLWSYNTAHTRSVCLQICLENFTTPYNLPDGTLNPCLQCDEDRSGPIFKAVGGRTRRNSGIPNAICRPCSEVQPLVHQY